MTNRYFFSIALLITSKLVTCLHRSNSFSEVATECSFCRVGVHNLFLSVSESTEFPNLRWCHLGSNLPTILQMCKCHSSIMLCQWSITVKMSRKTKFNQNAYFGQKQEFASLQHYPSDTQAHNVHQFSPLHPTVSHEATTAVYCCK